MILKLNRYRKIIVKIKIKSCSKNKKAKLKKSEDKIK
jgi:hypothetical protein